MPFGIVEWPLRYDSVAHRLFPSYCAPFPMCLCLDCSLLFQGTYVLRPSVFLLLYQL